MSDIPEDSLNAILDVLAGLIAHDDLRGMPTHFVLAYEFATDDGETWFGHMRHGSFTAAIGLHSRAVQRLHREDDEE